MKKLLCAALLLTAITCTHFVYFKRTKGFCAQKIKSQAHVIEPKHNTSIKNRLEILKILEQPYHYLASGTHMYAFVSQDKKYVLKFFKQNHLRPFSKLEKAFGYSLIPYTKNKLQKRLKTRQSLFDAAMLGYEDFRDRTGMLYLHLNPTTELKTSIHLIDQNGKPLTVDSDKSEFFIQLYAEPLLESIENWCASGQENSAKRAIDSIIDLVKLRCARGIGDDDNCPKNFGLIGEKVFEVDVSELWDDPGVAAKEHVIARLISATFDLRVFLKKKYPDLCQYLDEKLVNEMN